MKNYLFIILFCVFPFMISCSSDDEPKTQETSDPFEKNEPSKAYVKISLSRAEEEMIGNMTDFSFEAIQKIATGTGENVIISPYSISSVLSMLANGASGKTLEGYKSILKTDDINSLNVLNKKILERFPDLDNNVRFNSANALFYKNVEVKENFKKVLADYYNAAFYSDGQAQLNKWCNDNTWGMIKEFNLSDYPLVVLNATAFMGRWADSFNVSQTAFGKLFTTSDGTKQDCYMMRKTAPGLYYEGNGYKAAYKEYGNGAFGFTVVLPDENSSIDNLLATFDADEFGEYLENRSYVKNLELSLPRFKIENELLLSGMLMSLGLNLDINANGNYGNMTNSEGTIGFKQKALIEVWEEGTKAAAVTGNFITSDVDPNSHAKLSVNRPFLFLIHEYSTKAILFMGVVRSM